MILRAALLFPFLVLGLEAQPLTTDTLQFLKTHCVRCHGPEKQKGGITLDKFKTLDDAFEYHGLLENVLHQVEEGEMPPWDEDVQPTEKEKAALLADLGVISARIKSGDVPTRAGRVVLRRLNKNEYRYTVRDLFGVKFNPAANFPEDGAGGEGFDTMADALFSTPTLLEKYLQAATRVIDAVYADSQLRRKAIFESPRGKEDPVPVARKILRFHTSLAYRKRVTDQDLAPLLSAFQRGIQSGQSFADALRTPLTAILVNPRFLFRQEHDQKEAEEWPLTDFELATRLSYFLWSSMPDRELFQLADSQQLSQPDVLEAQIDRMLDSPKSRALSRHFAGQWIGFDRLINETQPDTERFPEFTRPLRRAMYFEAALFFSHLIEENRPITDLISSDYTFANETLAEHYQLSAKPSGPEMVKVPLDTVNRGGVLGMGGVLTSTSLPLRTSPVLRGVWILDTLLGSPAPPPPPDAGELPGDDTAAGGLTFREQLEEHRKKKECASCHARIDPLGFSLENYDAIGRWREKDANGKPIDSMAVMEGGLAFQSPADLKSLIMGGKDKFAENMCRKMLSYALGRPLRYYDEAILADLVKNLQKEKYHLRPLIKSVVTSRPFLMRSATR